MENIESFTKYLKLNDPQLLRKILVELDYDEIGNYDKMDNVDDDLLDFMCDNVRDYIYNHSTHIPDEDIEHEGGDESVFDDGRWKTELYEIHGWYYYIEPEGETFGLFDSLESAESQLLY